jgi:protein-S-isoprenylcysteine O-methyltransferase Ste14
VANVRLVRLALGALVFFILAPGMLAGVAPGIISGWWHQGEAPAAVRALGLVLVSVGLASLVESFARFVLHGHGTPAPTAPPTVLVVTGQYRYVRNPMYIALVTIVVGQGVWLASGPLFAYAVVLWALFHLRVVAEEESILARQFGDSFDQYRRNVPRWLPRRTAWRAQ